MFWYLVGLFGVTVLFSILNDKSWKEVLSRFTFVGLFGTTIFWILVALNVIK